MADTLSKAPLGAMQSTRRPLEASMRCGLQLAGRRVGGAAQQMSSMRGLSTLKKGKVTWSRWRTMEGRAGEGK